MAFLMIMPASFTTSTQAVVSIHIVVKFFHHLANTKPSVHYYRMFKSNRMFTRAMPEPLVVHIKHT
ncbi:hypothetical protein HYN43_003190 [Mucilaginibacter celer]|uniref:Uncharacterized protein n=1 Tax=Mucilaginibacter celer TaxID=2305508 RepID=A0A494VLE1_9SPHI|nr:hypothetical protein HYN43_003190 [Mucilaginibacter celer]